MSEQNQPGAGEAHQVGEPPGEPGRIDERARLREQTARNVAGLEHEQRGEADAAIPLYEANLTEGFAGVWPYSRLMLLYGQRGQPAEVVRVLERAVAVLAALPRSHPERGPRLRLFRQRLKEAQRALRPARPPRRRQAGTSEADGEADQAALTRPVGND
jgi:hypothetical protein